MKTIAKEKLPYYFPIFIIISLVASVAFQKIIKTIEWPAFNASNVTPTLCSALVTICLVLLGFLITFQNRFPLLISYLSSSLLLTGLTTSLLALPLGGTKLYLMGISVDQQFRTEYMTRFADSAHLADMTYTDVPPFYPPAWFWLGGRLANLLHIPAWEFYKTFAITSLVAAVLLTFWLWSLGANFTKAILLTVGTSLVIIQFNAFEPYGAVIAMLLPPILNLLWIGLSNSKTNFLVVSAIFLGLSAITYTLYTLIAIASILVMFLIFGIILYTDPINKKHFKTKILLPLVQKLLLIGSISGLIALITWTPYLLKIVSAPHDSSRLAMRYLPNQGSEFFIPLFSANLWGILAWIGVFWLVIKFIESNIAKGLTSLLIATYAWQLLSMLSTLAQTTLLGFRTEPLIYLAFTLAGIMGIAELIKLYENKNYKIAMAVGIIFTLGGVFIAQAIPSKMTGDIIPAYQDTDGYGQRGDKRPAGVEQYYAQMNDYILKTTKMPAHDSIVLTTDYSFLSMYPYWGFQNLTPHYANPLAQFKERNTEIQKWAEAKNTTELLAYLTNCPWKSPNVFIFRQGQNSYQLRLSEDRYPNDPNVKRFYIDFPKNLFENEHFIKQTIGPFAIFIKK